MFSAYDDLSFTDGMPIELICELIHAGIVPESCDPAYMTPEDWHNFHADMQAMPVTTPTDAEINDMAETFANAPF
jgi:hypothetical protein